MAAAEGVLHRRITSSQKTATDLVRSTPMRDNSAGALLSQTAPSQRRLQPVEIPPAWSRFWYGLKMRVEISTLKVCDDTWRPRPLQGPDQDSKWARVPRRPSGSLTSPGDQIGATAWGSSGCGGRRRHTRGMRWPPTAPGVRRAEKNIHKAEHGAARPDPGGHDRSGARVRSSTPRRATSSPPTPYLVNIASGDIDETELADSQRPQRSGCSIHITKILAKRLKQASRRSA